MKRWMGLAVGLVAVVAGVVIVVSSLGAADAPAHPGTTAFGSARLPLVEAVEAAEPELPEAKYSRTMFASTTLDGVDAWLDRCGGPVAVDVGDDRPTLVSEHDYCGGSAWMWDLDEQDVVELDGEGIDDGLYTVSSLTYLPRKSGASVGDLPDTDAVLQTCVSSSEMVLIGLDLRDDQA